MTFREKLDSFPQSAFAAEKVSLRPIREEQDLAYAVFDCTVTREQQGFVNPAGFSIGRAFLHPENNYPCVILNAQGQRVGFILLEFSVFPFDGGLVHILNSDATV